MHIKFRDIVAASLLFVVMFTSANADVVVDQVYDDTTSGESNIFASNWRGQLFTSGKSGILDSVEMKVKKQSLMIPTSAPMIVGIHNVSSGEPSSQIAAVSFPQSSVSLTSSFHSVDFSGFGISLTAGQQLAIVVRGPSLSTGAYDWALTVPGTYSGGHTTFSSNSGSAWSQFTDRDFHFRTLVNVPEPAGIAMFVVIGLCIFPSWRRQRRT